MCPHCGGSYLDFGYAGNLAEKNFAWKKLDGYVGAGAGVEALAWARKE
jgi:hypothetical protein